MNATDPNTGEIIESPAKAKELWREATDHEKAAKRLKDALKPYVAKLVEDNGGKPIVFEDGQQFVQVNSQSFIVPVTTAYSLVGDVDAFMDCLKENAFDLKKAAETLQPETVSELSAAKVPHRAKSFCKLERIA